MFTTSSTPVIGILLLLILSLAVYSLWDVAIARWFG